MSSRPTWRVGQPNWNKHKPSWTLLRNGATAEEIAIARQQVDLWRAQLQNEQPELAPRIVTGSLFEAQEKLLKLEKGTREEEIRAAEAEVKRLSAELAYSQELVNLGELVSPISGLVVTSNIDQREGHFVHEGELIAVIQDMSELHVEIAGDESAAQLVQVDMPVKIRLNGLNGRLLTGRVLRVATQLEDDAQFSVAGIRTDRELMTQAAVSKQ